MSHSDAKLLVVSNPDARIEIDTALEESGLGEIHHGDGGDSTLAIVREIAPDVVVLCAELDQGDARSLASAIRHARPHAAIVLIGQVAGPIRNALDASDFDVDHFIAQPVAAKALAYAVRTGIAKSRGAGPHLVKVADEGHRPLADSQIETRARTQSKIGELMDQAIDDFLCEAIAAIPEIASPEALASAAEEPESFAAEEPESSAAEEPESSAAEEPESSSADSAEPASGAEGGGAGPAQALGQPPEGAAIDDDVEGVAEFEELFADKEVKAPSATRPLSGPLPNAVPVVLAPDLDTARQAVPTAAHDEPTGKIPGAQLFSMGAELAEPVPLRGRLSTSAGDDDTTAPADWREETMVLGDGAGRAKPSGAAAPPSEGRPELDVPAGGGFARELRRKMSAMAERLFPDEKKPVELGVSHGAHTEIDLTALGGGVTNIGFRDDDDEWSGEDESTTAGTRTDDDWSATGIHRHLGMASGKHDVRGKIEEAGNDVASLLSRLFDLGVTGRLTFRRSGVEKTVFLDKGRPVFATSSLPHDRMGDLLFREGKLTRQQHIRSRELVAESGRRMGEILVAEGFLKERELMPAVRRHLEDLIYSLFAWTDGEFEIREDAIPSAEKIRLKRHPAALTVEGIRRKYDLSRLIELLGGGDPVVELTEAERINALAEQIELLPSETRAITHFDGREPLSRVARIADTDLLSAAQVGFALVAMGAAAVVSKEVADAEEPTVDRDLEPESSETTIDKQRILAKYEQVVDADYFHLLGVRRDSTTFEIRRAYELAVKDFAPASFADELQTELGHELAEIQYVLQEAYAVLSDDRIRTSYLSHLRG